MHPSHALLLLEQDEQRHNLIKNLLVKFLAQLKSFCVWQQGILCLSGTETCGLHCSPHFTPALFNGSSKPLSQGLGNTCIHLFPKIPPT